MTPSLLNLLMRGGYSYSNIAETLGMSKSRVRWFVMELERRKWIVVNRTINCTWNGQTIGNAVNRYRRGIL
ncbi:winged helix-turn-helix domain-containing protein [Paramixta manurensis]|uniref:winged helix-turn-helix domain-containing protein n=1 Tax=Paramixta manurensis TaxID=2740817 RepID=UPI00156AC281